MNNNILNQYKFLLVNPPLVVENEFIDSPAFSIIGMLYEASNLKKIGFNVEIIDFFLLFETEIKDNNYYLGYNIDKLILNINKKSSDYVIINFSNFIRSKELINNDLQKILINIDKKKHKKIILADFYMGDTVYFEYNPGVIKKKYKMIDYIFKGNFKDNIKIIIDDIIKLSKNYIDFKEILDKITFIEYSLDQSLIPLNKYINFFYKSINRELIKEYNSDEKIFPLFTSIGCNYNCIICANNQKISYKSLLLSDIKKNIKDLINLGIEKIFILDSVPNFKSNHFIDILNFIIKIRLKIYFVNGLRIDLLNEDIIKRLSKCCDLLATSIESGDQDFLNNYIKKNLSLNKARENFKLLYENKIKTYSHYIIGFPDEKIDSINKTLDFAWEMYKLYNIIPRVQYYVPVNIQKIYNEKYKCKIDLENFQNIPVKFIKKRININKLIRLKENFYNKIDNKESEKIITNLTYKCNNNCLICAIGDRKKENIDFKYLKKYIEKAYKKGIRSIDLDGGEPTLYPYLFELLDFIVIKGFQNINITTNGRMLSYDNFTKKLSKYPISILISLYSINEKTHNFITRSKASYKQTIDGINNAIKYFKNIGINTTITRYNYNELFDIAEFIRNNNINTFNIQYLSPFGNASKKNLINLKIASCVIKKIITTYKNFIKINIINFPHCHLIGYEDYLIRDYFKVSRKMLFVNKKEVNLADYLNGKRFKEEKCSKCINNCVCSGFWMFNNVL